VVGVSRELRSLVPFEVVAVIALGVVPLVIELPAMVPIAMPLLVVASISRWLRGRSWSEVTATSSIRVGVGFAAGLAALAIVSAVGARETTALSPIPIAGDAKMGAMVIAYVVITAILTELALRGWIVERVLELSPGSPVLPICVGAIAEAIVTPGDPATRAGAALFGVGLGAMYVFGGRNAIAPMVARAAYFGGAIALEGFA
jgi:hypothetical protein